MKAVFFDRDGVLNRELGRYVTHAEEFEVNNWVVLFMQSLKNAGYTFFVITNQGGISKGLYTHTDLFVIHTKLINTLAAQGITITEIYYCPHHSLQTQCLCRKPGSVMLEKAVAKYGVDVAKSFLIGDTERDIEAAERIGLKAFQILPNFPPQSAQMADIESLTGAKF
jgi:D-glycero-D-manno-heptose 1,7-bisphosphate phosphatase